MKKLLFSACLVLGFGAGYAQMGFGIEAGYNLSNYTIRSKGAMIPTDMRYGGRLGALADMALTDNLYFQPGIYYVSNGYKMNIANGYQSYRVNTIEIPLNIEYKIGMLGTNRVFLGAGPYVGWNKDGNVLVHTNVVDSRRDLMFGAKKGNDFKAIDFGAGVNVGFQLTAGLFARLRGQMGIVNLDPSGTKDSYIRNYGFSLSVGYLFYVRNSDGTLKINRERNKHKHEVQKHNKM